MNLPAPFAYAAIPHARQHGPQGYIDYQNFKPWLRDEFVFRCVYCLERETWYPSQATAFSVEHFEPKESHHSGKFDYDNLLYACVKCNAFKQDVIIQLDPTQVAFADHIRVKEDGHIESLTSEGQDLIDLLHLDEEPALELRKQVILILQLKQEHPDNSKIRQLFLHHFGFPGDLPDLRSLRPKNNTRPSGVDYCHFERRQKNMLPEVY